MLLQNGAKFFCDSYGIIPLLLAAVRGHSKVVQYLANEYYYTKQDTVNALELLGSAFMKINSDVKNAFICWKHAMELRYEDGRSPLEKPTTRSPISYYVDSTEVRTLHQLEESVNDPDEMRVQALLVVERILGPSHPDTYRCIMYIGARYIENGNVHRCLKLWMYAVDAQQKVKEPLNSRIQKGLLSLTALFSLIISENRTLQAGLLPVSFQDILHVFKICLIKIKTDLHIPKHQRDNKYISHLHRTLITTIHLVGLMCMLQPYLNIYEDTELKQAIYELVHLNPTGRNGSTLLHLTCCRESSSLVRGYDFSVIEFPSSEVVDLLLELGACPNAVDEAKNTPLHIVAMNMPCAPDVFKTLLNRGAHLDFCNYARKNPLQLAKTMPSLYVYPMRYITLQCLSAQAIRKHGIAYEGLVPETLKVFLDSH